MFNNLKDIDFPEKGNLRINDVFLTIPPESISITITEYDKSMFLLREALPSTQKTGKKKILVNFPIAIDIKESGYQQLSRLLIQIRKTPIATVENEKIRLEILGPNSDLSTNIAMLIESITCSVDKEYPSLLRCNIQMSWFNHLSYVPKICYKGNASLNETTKSNIPRSLYKEFYEYDTMINGKMINDPSDDLNFNEEVLEILYKEYKRIPSTEIIDFTSIGDQEEDGIPAYLKRPEGLPEDQGWINAATQGGYTENDEVYYRWRKFEIPVYEFNESGPLILEDLSFSLQTNISYIPLQGHSVPIPQFLGGSISQLRAIIFASAEIERDAEKRLTGKPIGTSEKLGQLQKILDQIGDNRFQYAKYAREDFILIRHPLAKLLKYDKYLEKRASQDSYYYDENKRERISFSYDDFLPVVSSNRISKTVEGLPFCSRLQIDFKETRLPKQDDLVQIVQDNGKLSRDSYKESWQNTLKEIEKSYNITYVEGNSGGFFKIENERNDPDQMIAERLANRMTSMNYLDSNLKSLSDIFDSNYFKLDSGVLKSKVAKKYRGSGLSAAYSGKSYAETQRGKGADDILNHIRKYGFLNSEGASVLSTDLLKLTAKTDDDWTKKYEVASLAMKHFNYIPQSQTYKDIKIPIERTSPTFYLYDYNFDEMYRRRAINGMIKQAENVESKLASSIFGEEAAAARGPEIMAAKPGFSNATNIPATEGNHEKHGGVHKPTDATHRASLSALSIQNMTPMTASLRKAYPAFKIYLKQDNLMFEKELSIADLSQKDKLKASLGYKDFSENFDVNSIIDIRLIKDEHEAADLLVLRIAMTQKDLVNKTIAEMKKQKNSRTSEMKRAMAAMRDRKRANETTDAERQLAKEGLREGVRIQCRLGYSTNPNGLSPEFNGKIVSVRGRDVVEVICMGNGTELVQEVKGINKGDTYSFNSNTPSLISGILENAPEVVSFGNTNYKSDLGAEINFFPRFMGGRSALDNIFAPSLFDSYTDISTEAIDGSSFGFSAAVAATSLFGASSVAGVLGSTIAGWGTAGALGAGVLAAAPLISVLAVGVAAGAAIWGAAEAYKGVKRWLFGSPFTIYNRTLWEILQELTLRHPGTICSVVPFDNRSTIFFGEPNEYYFHRGPSPIEAGIITEDTILNNTIRETADDEIFEFDDTKTLWGLLSSPFTSMSNADYSERKEKRKQTRKKVQSEKELTDDEVIMNLQKPYRTYHLISSEHDIICNDMEVTSRGVSNSVQVAYPKDSDDANFDGSQGFSDYDVTNDLKADDDIYKEYIKKKVVTFHNAHKDAVDDMPERYGVSLLCKELEKVYRGKISILGRPEIKPHDVCILRDTYNEIYGPVGVSRVVQTISPHGGWITEITPKMMVFPSNASGYFQLAMVYKGAAFWLAGEVEQFYTDRRPFLLDSHGNSTGAHDASEAVGQIYGNKKVDLDKANIEDLDTNYVKKFRDDNAWYEGDITEAILEGTGTVAGQVTGNMISPYLAGATVESAKALSKTVSSRLGTVIGVQGAQKIIEGGKLLGAGSLGASKVALSGLGTAMSAFGGIAAHLIIDSMFDGFINWSKYRQPILFYPVTRHGQAWYAAMDGFLNNSALEHISDQFERTWDKTKYYYETASSLIGKFLE